MHKAHRRLLVGAAAVLLQCRDRDPGAADTGEQAATGASSRVKPRAKEHAAPAAEQLGTRSPGLGLDVGAKIPDVTARDPEGNPVRLHDLAGRQPLLLVFYRGGWCPYCNFQIRELTQAYSELARRSVLPVAVSVDAVEQAAATKVSYEIPFPILSDPDLDLHRAFRVVHHASDTEVERLKAFGMDIERSSGRAHHDFAVPAIFLIDREGTVRWAHVDVDYRVRPSVQQVLVVIDRSPP